jgi:hypothetical protein
MNNNQRMPDVINAVREAGLTYLSESALSDLYETTLRLEESSMEGIIVEAGCALGGSAIVLASAKSPSRPLAVYDVFGMIPPPSELDGSDVHERYRVIVSGEAEGIAGKRYYGYEENLLEQVRSSFLTFGLDPDIENIRFVRGLFEDTLHIDEPVALAHIDGDWYQSVMTCLERIEPRIVPGGVMVIDDYEHWSGCRKAVDEYFAGRSGYRFEQRSRLHIRRLPE